MLFIEYEIIFRWRVRQIYLSIRLVMRWSVYVCVVVCVCIRLCVRLVQHMWMCLTSISSRKPFKIRATLIECRNAFYSKQGEFNFVFFHISESTPKQNVHYFLHSSNCCQTIHLSCPSSTRQFVADLHKFQWHGVNKHSFKWNRLYGCCCSSVRYDLCSYGCKYFFCRPYDSCLVYRCLVRRLGWLVLNFSWFSSRSSTDCSSRTRAMLIVGVAMKWLVVQRNNQCKWEKTELKSGPSESFPFLGCLWWSLHVRVWTTFQDL